MKGYGAVSRSVNGNLLVSPPNGNSSKILSQPDKININKQHTKYSVKNLELEGAIMACKILPTILVHIYKTQGITSRLQNAKKEKHLKYQKTYLYQENL